MTEEAWQAALEVYNPPPRLSVLTPPDGALSVRVDTTLSWSLTDVTDGIDWSLTTLRIDGVDVSADLVMSGTREMLDVVYLVDVTPKNRCLHTRLRLIADIPKNASRTDLI